MNDVAPPGIPGNPPNAAPSAGGGGLSKNAIIAIVVAALVAVALIAFFVGRSNGESKGKDDVSAEYKPGQPKYDAIYQAGQQAGQATGEQQGQQTGEQQGTATGKKVGLEKGEQQGQVTGANDVFGAYSSWDVGSFYIVQIGKGSGGVDYTLGARTQMAEGEQYKLCEDDPSTICVVSAPQSSGGSP